MRTLGPAILSAVLVASCIASAAPSPTASPIPAPTASVSATASPSPTLPPTPSPPPTLPPTPSPTLAPTPSPSPSAQPEPFTLDLYREGSFVSEAERFMCLPAAMQVMINIMRDGPLDTSRKYQDHLYQLARTFLVQPCVNCEEGATPEGWAGALNLEGYGPYEMAITPTLTDAIHLAAFRLRLTGKPVGLLVWRGAHSWAMSGFESDVDPLVSPDFEVHGIYADDVWYPRISSIWGPSFPANHYYSVEDLPIDYKKYNRPNQLDPDKDGQYVLIVPVVGAGV